MEKQNRPHRNIHNALGLFMLTLLLLTGCSWFTGEKVVAYNTNFPDDSTLIHSNDSNFFDYAVVVSITEETDLLMVTYKTSIQLKDKSKTIQNVGMTCVIESDLLAFPNRQFFGTILDDTTTLSKDNFGIETALRTPLKSSLTPKDKDTIIKDLTQPIKVMVTSDDGTEWVLLDPSQITIQWNLP